MSSFYNVYVSLCAEHGESLTSVAKKIGLSNAAPNGWKKGKEPSDVTLAKIADYFNVPIDFLLTGEKPAAEGEPLDDDLQELLDLTETMNDSERRLMLNVARSIVSERTPLKK